MSRKNNILSIILIIFIIIAMLVIGYYSKEINKIDEQNHEKDTIEEEKTYVSISVMLPEDMTNKQIVAVGDAIKKVDGVNGITFVSRDEAFEKEKKKQNNNELTIEEVSEPIRAYYVVMLTDNKYLEQVKNKLNEIDNNLETIVKETKLPANGFK